jgi:cobalt-zinc-cadmium efflux system outer membrane protein
MTINLKIFRHRKPIVNRFSMPNLRESRRSLLALCLCFTAMTGANELEPQALDLRTAIARSLEHNPELASVEFRVKSADAYTQQAAVGERPEVSLSVEDALGSGDFSGLDSSQSTLSISWILERSLLERRVSTKQSEKDVIQVEQEIKKYDISAATAHAFLTALALQERLSIAKKAAQSAGRVLTDIRKLTKSGKTPVADLLRAEVDLKRRQLEIDDITHELAVAKRLLAAKWGATSINFATLAGSLVLDEAVVDFPELERRVLESARVNLFLTQERVKQSEIALAEEEAKNRLRFNTGVRRIDRSDDYALVLGVSMPFGGTKRNKARINALTQEQAGHRSDARAEQVKLSAKLYALFESFRHNTHLSEALDKEIIPRLEEALIETRKAYDIGKYSYREWSSVQQDVLTAKLELTDTRLAAHSNAVELERLTGQSISTNSSTDLETQ